MQGSKRVKRTGTGIKSKAGGLDVAECNELSDDAIEEFDDDDDVGVVALLAAEAARVSSSSSSCNGSHDLKLAAAKGKRGGSAKAGGAGGVINTKGSLEEAWKKAPSFKQD